MQGNKKILKSKLNLEAMYKRYKKFLKGAKEGEVVTRFPPEPSGYLHIGHIKAACLNYHYSKMFKGKFLLRFDDTNPSKEKEEFKESILKDLKTLNIIPDQISNSSDHFDFFLKKCDEFIAAGLGYCDALDSKTMKEQRMNKIDSIYRNTPIAENLKIWEEMKIGEQKKYCVRAKINMQSNNGCLRDPVIFRHCEIPHHITGTKFKVYPTYDFACPIIDSIEGVTHAMRSNEYSDRNALYSYMLKKMKLRKVKIQDFSRLNFINTTLSKRKLGWFVGQGIVTGWDDPRFPTTQGILRRGMMVDTLIEFMIEQGPSKNSNLMEWDKIWAKNRKRIDKISPRYSMISKKNAVSVEVVDTDGQYLTSTLIPLHPKDKSIGQKSLTKSTSLLVEGEDVKDLKAGSKIVLMKWGVFELKSVDLENKKITAKYLPEDKDFKHPPKINWINQNPNSNLVIKILEYGHLLTVAKPDAEKEFKDFVNMNSKYEMDFVAEGSIRSLEKGDVVQFERRGFYILDSKKITDTKELKMEFIFIPDGKTKTMSGLNTNIDSKKLSKGN